MAKESIMKRSDEKDVEGEGKYDYKILVLFLKVGKEEKG